MINSFTFGVGYGNNKNMCTNSKLLGVKLPKNVSLLKKIRRNNCSVRENFCVLL